jgi:dolichyl-phosphate-mannose--protein O-mannosyl transferase
VKLISVAVFFLSHVFFLFNIQFPSKQNFDEFHYVPSAKQFLAMTTNQNWEHPPLGKILMAIGIAIWGDQPLGWRYMSTIFGSLTLVGAYLLAYVIFANETVALWVALLTLVNNLLYVQARIGMLDTFMFAFLIWALVGFCALWDLRNSKKENFKLLAFTGVMLGLSTACKWYSVIPWFACLGLVVLIRLLQFWQTQFKNPREEDWYLPQLWNNVSWKDLGLGLVAIPLGMYFLTFVPYLFVSGSDNSLLDLFRMQYKMWDGQLRVVTSHPYMSNMLDWPTLKRPIWYAFDREGPNNAWVRGVILLGNPLIMWTGLLALGVCAWSWVRERNRQAFLILFFYSVFYGCWAIIPRKISFYYYYYPAGMILSYALAYTFLYLEQKKIVPDAKWKWFYLGLAFSLFIYFFPILAGLKIQADSFRNWMWFSSWI